MAEWLQYFFVTSHSEHRINTNDKNETGWNVKLKIIFMKSTRMFKICLFLCYQTVRTYYYVNVLLYIEVSAQSFWCELLRRILITVITMSVNFKRWQLYLFTLLNVGHNEINKRNFPSSIITEIKRLSPIKRFFPISVQHVAYYLSYYVYKKKMVHPCWNDSPLLKCFSPFPCDLL